MNGSRGKLYWKPSVVRILINGRFLDLGARSLASARVVAEEFVLSRVVSRDEVSRVQRVKPCESDPSKLKLPAQGSFSRL